MKRNKIPIILFTLVLLVNLTATMPPYAYAADGNFVPVENITDVPKTTPVGTPLELKGTVVPEDATYKTITWNVKNAGATGATIADGFLNATAAGNVVVAASIVGGARISAGKNHTMALKADGSLWAWGCNGDGQLGDGSNEDRFTPVRVGTDNDWAAVVAGDWHTIALKTDGSMYAWGDNWFGLLGVGKDYEEFESSNIPVRVGNDNDWAAISAGQAHAVALKTNGSIYTWGDNWYGRLGVGITYGEFENSNIPVRAGNDSDWAAISAGESYTIALKTNGTLWAWGYNYGGQLGDGSKEDRFAPVRVGTDNDWAEKFAAGFGHTVALKTDGSMHAWGWNGEGQLGILTDEDYITTPRQVGFDNDWDAVEAGDSHTVALKTNGTLYTWGWNGVGQLGDGTYEDSATPVRVGEDSDWIAISTHYGNHTVAIKKDGVLMTWGDNGNGKLGVGADDNGDPVVDESNTPLLLMLSAAYTDDFTIYVFVYGDVNGDGVVNSRDVMILERWIAGWPVEINENASDVNGDGVVNSRDVIVLDRHFAGWPGYETLPYKPAQPSPIIPMASLFMNIEGMDAPVLELSPVTAVSSANTSHAHTLVGVKSSASVKKLSGNKIDLTISVTESFSDGSVNAITITESVNNNSAGYHQVGRYTVYVETKGNDQIRECYIVE